MTIACDLLQRHTQTLVDENTQWQTLITDDVLWELAYAPSIGLPAQLSGREEAIRHANWFVGAVENFRFFELKVYALADPERAVAEVKGAHQVYGTYVSPGLCAIPACCRRQDRVPTRIFRSCACR
jgi:hypothetical protein